SRAGDQGDELSLGHGEGDVAQRGERVLAAAIGLADVLDGNEVSRSGRAGDHRKPRRRALRNSSTARRSSLHMMVTATTSSTPANCSRIRNISPQAKMTRPIPRGEPYISASSTPVTVKINPMRRPSMISGSIAGR